SPTSSPAAGTDPADMRTWRASRSTASRSNAEAESIRRKPKVNPSLRSIGIVAAALMSIGALAPAHSQQGRPPPALGDGPWDLQTETGMVHVSVLTKDLESPWGLVFLPDGGMLVTERPGRLRVIRDGKLDPNPIQGLPDLVATGISGLFGLALHPNFAQNRLIYFAYPKPQPADRDALTLAVARA